MQISTVLTNGSTEVSLEITSTVSLFQRESHHTLNVDVTSQTFFDSSFRFASRKDGITASMSSPTSGFLGLHLQRRSMSQLYGKLFCRYMVRHSLSFFICILESTENKFEIYTID